MSTYASRGKAGRITVTKLTALNGFLFSPVSVRSPLVVCLVFAPFFLLHASPSPLCLLQLLREVLSQASRIVADLSPLLANYSTMATLQVPRLPRYHKSERVYADKETHTLHRPTFQNAAAAATMHTHRYRHM